MLLAIFSDVHGNTQVLERALAYFQARGVDGYLQLGDLGQEPLTLLEGLPVRHAFGNWEVSSLPNLSARWRQKVADWPALIEGEGWVASHATPAFPAACNTTQATFDYMNTHHPRWMQLFPSLLHDEQTIWAAFAELEAQDRLVAFHGHTHVQAVQRFWQDNRLVRLSGPKIDLPPGTRTLVGVGSLGVPRDGRHPRCVLFDTAAMQIELLALT
ncbi:MAG: metallophosphoesterase family protein [Caldilineales bacterium]|nr:metallophosphoesterase family protein [Caldilineales bacterium]